MDKIICLGKNYLAHAMELGDEVPERPVLFLKPPSSLVCAARVEDRLSVRLPVQRGAVHYECEIVLRLNPKAEIDAVTLGLDLTLRDLQADLKKKGHPWEISKVFPGAAILGPWIPIHEFSEFVETEFQFTLGGSVRQRGVGARMRLGPAECVTYVKEYFPVCEGDVIFTGTPEGVGPVRPGQTAELRWGERLLYSVDFM